MSTNQDFAAYEQLVFRLRQRFPNLQPISKYPPLIALGHSTGLCLVGERDRDRETGTCVKTLAATWNGVPLLLFRAYRVLAWERCLRQASRGEGEGAAIARWCKLKEPTFIFPWEAPEKLNSHYFIGREPLSSLARTWNCIVAAALVFLVVLSFRAWSVPK